MRQKNDYKYISAAELLELQRINQDILLLDPLPKTRYEQSHAQGAENACVYEVTFLDQVESICNRRCNLRGLG